MHAHSYFRHDVICLSGETSHVQDAHYLKEKGQSFEWHGLELETDSTLGLLTKNMPSNRTMDPMKKLSG